MEQAVPEVKIAFPLFHCETNPGKAQVHQLVQPEAGIQEEHRNNEISPALMLFYVFPTSPTWELKNAKTRLWAGLGGRKMAFLVG